MTPDIPFTFTQVCPTGSAYICNPPVLDTDRDFAVQTACLDAAAHELRAAGWEVTVDDPTYTITLNGELPFITARKGIFNLIIFDTDEAFDAFAQATEVAKRLNVTYKADRVALFQAVCGGRARREDDFDLGSF